jgi:hypothetical protein
MIENWRIYIIVILMTLSLVDLGLTYHYIYKYKKWQPEKPFNLIEKNPLLVFLWNKLGLHLGMFVGSVIILTLIYIVGKEAHWIIVLLLCLFLSWAMFNHYTNINLLHKLIEKYPSGYLPKETFGGVIGNNPK